MNLFSFPPSVVASSDILKEAFYTIRPTFLTRFTMPNWSVWTKREIDRLCAYAANEYCGVYNPKKKTVVSFDNHFHIGYTLHRAFKAAKIKHRYREIHPSDPEYLKILMEHTNAHCLALLKSTNIAVQSKKYPSDENITFVQDEIANLRSWFRSNARCWWLFHRYVAVQELDIIFKKMVIESNKKKLSEHQEIDESIKSKLITTAFRAIQNNRPKPLAELLRSRESPLYLTTLEFENLILKSSEGLVRETKIRSKDLQSRSRGNVSKKAMRRMSKSYRRSLRAQRQIVSAIYEYFGVLPF